MNSRFKFVQSVNPQQVPTKTVKPKFSKLTLATTKFVAIESINEQTDRTVQGSQTVTRTTTTRRTTMTKVLNECEVETGEMSCAQKQKILLYESTKDENHSDILTDDDTDSVGSSIDSKEIEAGLKEISQPTTQGTMTNIDQIGTQLGNMSFLSPPDRGNLTANSEEENITNMSRQLDKLEIQSDDHEETKIDEKIVKREKSFSSCSVQTLSSSDTVDQDPMSHKETEDKLDSSIIVLSDSDTEDLEPETEARERIVSQEPPLKPTYPSSNDNAVYNLSTLDSADMQKVNNFFDNAPFVEPINSSFNTSCVSKTPTEDLYVPETEDEESIEECKSVVDSTLSDEKKQPYKVVELNELPTEDADDEQPDFSDNNIIVDIPVFKSSSDQPRQIIRSQSGVRLTASRSSPIKKHSIDSECIRRTPGNVILKTPGSSIRVNSNNGQLNIAAKININIQIVEDSSEESEDNKSTRKSQAIQSSEECQRSSDGFQSAQSNSSDAGPSKPACSRSPTKTDTRTPAKNCRLNVDTATKTPNTASKLKQFEFVPPKSLTKNKNPDTPRESERNPLKPVNQSLTSESSDGQGDGFQIDRSIPISPRDQKLLHKVYGDAWKTPEVIKSYSAVKGKPATDRAAVNATPTSLKNNRYSKGFDLFKEKIKRNLDSTRLSDHAEISIIEAPVTKTKQLKSPENVLKPKSNTPRSKVKTAPKKLPDIDPSPSVLTKKKPSTPKSTKKKVTSPTSDSSSIMARPRRNVVRKPILDSDDDKENESDWSDDSSYSESDILTDDDSDNEKKSKKAPSVRSNGTATRKRPTKKTAKDDLIYLDLSSEEIVQVDENFHANVSEHDLANITRRFLEADLNDEQEKPKKKGRKLFTQSDDIEYDITFDDPKTVAKKPAEEKSLNIEIPRFTHKLFDSKKFGSPSQNKTPISKKDHRIDEFKTPSTSKILGERKTPFGSAKSKLDSPPKMFETYGFLKSLDVEASMMLCHPDAKKYRENFRANKEELTNVLYKLYNEKVFDNKLDVDILWNKKLTTTAGRFHGTKSVKLTGKKNRVELSEKVLTSADRLRCTLIHELCHAATWIFDKDKGHGARWKSWARKANQAFPELPIISVCHNYDIEYKYTYKCDMCHSKSYSHSKSKKVENIRCSYCHGMISIFLNKKKDGKVVMEPVREATGFAKYVKENYKDFKRQGVKHAEVMRQISSQYAMLSQEEKKMY